jgi:transcription initiation factor IIE alpha subunit
MRTFTCPGCKKVLDELRYESKVTEYGDVGIDDDGLVNWNGDTFETDLTDLFCPYCDRQLDIKDEEEVYSFNSVNK